MSDLHSLAIFPGSFDPFTLGHAEVVEQSLSIFEKIIIAIGESPSKSGLFSHHERKEMIAEYWKDNNRVEVETFPGLVVNFASKIKAKILIRGLRTEADFSYEMPMAMTNREIGGIMTLFIPTDPKFAYVSSSLVREVAKHGGDVSAFVSNSIAEKINAKTKS